MSNKLKNISWIILSLLINPFKIWGIDIVPVRLENNLSSNSISSFSQDDFGFIWIGTDNGIERFDGYSSYKSPFIEIRAVSRSGRIESLYKDQEGNMWIGTSDGAFFYHTGTEIAKKILDVRVLGFLENKTGDLWIATNKGLYLIDKSGKHKMHLTQHNGLSSNRISAIIDDKDGNLWIGTETGIDKLEINQDGNIKITPFITNQRISFLLIDSRDCLWYSSREFLYHINRHDLLNNTVPPSIISDVADISAIHSNGNEIWVGTKGCGIFRYFVNPNSQQYEKETFWIDKDNENDLKNTIMAFFEDSYSNIWVGTKDGIYMILRKQYSPFKQLKSDYKVSQRLSHNTISGLYCDSKNRVWMATAKGLNCFWWKDRLKEQFQIDHYLDNTNVANQISNNKFQSVIGIDNHTLMLSTKNDISFFDLNKKQFYTNQAVSDTLNKYQLRFVRSFCKDNKGHIYMAFASGNLACYNINDQTICPIILHNNDSWGVVQDKTGYLWVASGKEGMFRLKIKNDHNDNVCEVNTYEQSLFNNNYVVSLYCDHNNMLWIGTSGGLYQRTPDNEIIYYNLPYQENNDYIIAITEDIYNNLWVYSIEGIYKIGASREKENIQYFEPGNEDIGRLFYVFGRCLNKEGWLFSGGTNGLTYFEPTLVNQENAANAPVISAFRILNKDVVKSPERGINNINITEGITLYHNDYQFSFDLSSLYLPNPYKIKYAYMLEGFDKDWIYLSPNNRTITFTNIKPGNYRLRLKATDTSGLWSGHEKELKIKILPPWWNTWWSYGLYALAVFTLFYFAFRYITAQYRFRHQEEINQWKFRFYINLSHSFITPLNLLQAPLSNILNNFDQLSGEEIRNMLCTMQKNIKRLLHLVNQLMEFRKIDLDKSPLSLSCIDIIAFIRTIYHTFGDVAHSKQVDFSFETDTESTEAWIDKDKIENALFNILSNALKFTPSQGKVAVKCILDKQNDRLGIFVSDTGSGISEKNQKYIFNRFWSHAERDDKSFRGPGIGLALAHDYIKMHHSHLCVESEPGKGSCFYFYILLGNGHFDLSLIEKEETEDIQFSKKHIDIEQPELFYEMTHTNTALPLIYILEPNPELGAFVQYSLRKDFQIVLFSTLSSLTATIRSTPPVLIVSDIISTENLEGIELCKSIKSSTLTGHIPFIITSSMPEADMEVIAYEVGADVYFTKPYELSYLKTRINQLLQSRVKVKERIKQELIVNPKEIRITSTDDIFLANVMNKLEEKIADENLTIDTLADSLNISRTMLYRRISNITGLPPVDFIKEVKLKRAAQLLETGSFNVTEVGYRVGFQDARYFSTCFKKQFGISPKAYSLNKSKKR